MIFDDYKKDGIEEKVHRAYHSFLIKYDKTPDVCVVHPSMITGKVDAVVPVETDQYVMVNYFWIGIKGITDPIQLEE